MQAGLIGSVARMQLGLASSGRVIGRSSGGLFLRLDTGWVIFLACGGHPGPLTIQLPRTEVADIPAGVFVQAGRDQLNFPPPYESVDLRIADIWQAPPVRLGSAGPLPPAERANRLEEMARRAWAQRPGAGWSALLPGNQVRLEALAGLPSVVPPTLERLRAALARLDSQAAVEALSGLLGLGNGLTPSGDDLALGLLLAVKRWGMALAPRLDQGWLLVKTIGRARQTTTDLSASLIEAAAQGQADLRLVAALDYVVLGEGDPAKCAAGLAAWGNSSGLDALLGMSLLI